MGTIFSVAFRNVQDMWVAFNLIGRMCTRFAMTWLMARLMPSEALATWYIFLAVFGITALLEGGLGRVVTRQTAVRFPEGTQGAVPARHIIYVMSVLRAYFRLVLLVCLAAAIAGMVWFHLHSQGALQTQDLYVAWGLYVLASGIGLFSGLYGSLLSGMGGMVHTQRNELLGNVLYALAGFALFRLSHGVIVPALSMLAASLVTLYLNRTALRAKMAFRKHTPTRRYWKALAARIYPEMSSIFLIMLSYQLMTSVQLLLLGHYETPETVASYGLAMQFINIVITFAMIWITSSFPDLAGAETPAQVRSTFHSAIKRSAAFLVIGYVALLTLPPLLVRWAEFKTQLPSFDIYSWMVSVVVIETVLSLFSQMLISRGILTFASSSLLAALCVCASSWGTLAMGAGLLWMLAMRLVVYVLVNGVPVIRSARYALGYGVPK